MYEKTKDNRLIRAKLLMIKLKHHGPGMLCFFSDEKIFFIRAKIQPRE